MSPLLMEKRKGAGRPRSFDIDTALSKAIAVFWAKGYDGASMRDLTQAMGITSPSLYAVFGDKKGLYLRAIERYINDDSCAPLLAYEAAEDIESAVRAFMEAALDYATQQAEGQLGCFMANCVSTSTTTVAESQGLLQQAIVSADKRLAARFDREKQQGNLDKNFPSLERARLMFDLRQGYVLRARAGMARRVLKKDLDFRVQMVLHAEE